MGLSRVRNDAGNGVGRPDITNGKEPLVDKMSRFTYDVTAKQIKLFAGIGAKLELRKIAETGMEKEGRIEAIKGLVELEDKNSIPVLEEIQRTDPEAEVRDEAGHAILKLKGESREFVERGGIETLDIGEIIEGVVEIAGAEAVPEDDFPVFEIDDPNAKKRFEEYAKMKTLEKFRNGDQGNVYMVIEFALMDGNVVLQKKAIEALINSEDRNALNAAKLIIRNDEENKELHKKLERKIAALSVKEFLEGDEKKLSEVAQMLFKSVDSEVRKMAFEALVGIKNPDGLETIRLYLSEDEKKLTKEEMEFKRYVLKEMDEIKHLKFLDTFIDVLRATSDPGIMNMLISSLYMYGSTKAVPVLEYTSNRSDVEEGIRKDAGWALGLLKR